MNYAIIGTGKEGQALARKQIEVAIASRRRAEALAPVAKAIGRQLSPRLCRRRSRPTSSFWPGQDRDRRDKRVRCRPGRAGQPSFLRRDIPGLSRRKTREGLQPFRVKRMES